MRPERKSVPGLADVIDDLEGSLTADRSPRNVMRIAEALWLLEQPDRALDVLRPLVHESPELIAPRILLSWCADDAGLSEEAERERAQAAALDPANPYARPTAAPAPSAAEPPEPGIAAEAEPAPVAVSLPGPDPELEAEPERALDAADLREVPPGPLYSATLAEIFAKQGFQEKAIEIYRRLALQDPARSDLHSRIRALEEQAGGTQP